jgi:Arc/MetJ-type ribon-helix-helix transcriptional regulator
MDGYFNVKLSSFYIEKIDELVEAGQFTSRADAVREALRILFRTIEEEKKGGRASSWRRR